MSQAIQRDNEQCVSTTLGQFSPAAKPACGAPLAATYLGVGEGQGRIIMRSGERINTNSETV